MAILIGNSKNICIGIVIGIVIFIMTIIIIILGAKKTLANGKPKNTPTKTKTGPKGRAHAECAKPLLA